MPGTTRALIGWTGFVGGELARRADWAARFRSTDIDQLPSAAVNEIVCAGAPAEKWKANADPEQDKANLQPLFTALAGSTAGSCVLISTVDVYADSQRADEDTPPDTGQEQAYGRHRAELEAFVAERFERSLIVRLPGMFGPGLKKNLVHDLIHQPEARFANARSSFQFYDVRNLWGHILLAQEAGLSVVNLATAPVVAGDVARQAFDVHYICDDRPEGHYDLRTRQAGVLAGRSGPYLSRSPEVLAGIRAWGAAEIAQEAR